MEKVKTTRSNTTSHMVILVAATATCYTLHSSIYVRRRDHVELHLLPTFKRGRNNTALDINWCIMTISYTTIVLILVHMYVLYYLIYLHRSETRGTGIRFPVGM